MNLTNPRPSSSSRSGDDGPIFQRCLVESYLYSVYISLPSLSLKSISAVCSTSAVRGEIGLSVSVSCVESITDARSEQLRSSSLKDTRSRLNAARH